MVLSRIIQYYPTHWFYLVLMDVLMEQSKCKHFLWVVLFAVLQIIPVITSSVFWLIYLPPGWWVFLVCPSSLRTDFLFLHAFHAHSCLKWPLFHLNFCVIYSVFPYLFSNHGIQFFAESLTSTKTSSSKAGSLPDSLDTKNWIRAQKISYLI